MIELIVHGVDELDGLMPRLAGALGARRKVALYGDLGAGKTTLVKAFCRYLGVTDATASPTFSLINIYHYHLPDGQTGEMYHLDLYRLKTAEEVLDLGIEELLDNPWYCFIEWPQLIEPLLPDDHAKIHLEFLGNTARRMLIL